MTTVKISTLLVCWMLFSHIYGSVLIKRDDNLDVCEVKKPVEFHPINSFSDLELHHYAWAIALMCAISAVYMSFKLIYNHLTHYFVPQYQRHIVRILLMVPIYSVCSVFSLFFFQDSIYFDVSKNCFEAFAIYEFFALLLQYLGQDDEAQEAAMRGKPVMRYPIPCQCWKFDPKDPSFFISCKRMTLQYVLIHPVTSLIAVVSEALGILCPDSSSLSHPLIWLTNIECISVTVAMYGLILFYIVTADEIRQHRPIPKFVAVKFVIFFSFWQSIGISMAASFGWIKETEFYTVSNIETSIQAFLICCEMLMAAFMHNSAFGYKEFIPDSLAETPIAMGLRDAFSIKETVQELKWAMRTDAIKDTDTEQIKEKGAIVHFEGIASEPSLDNANENDQYQMKKGKKTKKNYSALAGDAMEALENQQLEEDEENLDLAIRVTDQYVSLKEDNEEASIEKKITNIALRPMKAIEKIKEKVEEELEDVNGYNVVPTDFVDEKEEAPQLHDVHEKN